MAESSRPSIQIDLKEFKLHLRSKGRTQLTLLFNSPSRKFYLSVIALVVNEMKKSQKIRSIPLQKHLDLIALLNETVGGAAGSSEKENLLHRICTKWKDALPNLEEAPLFRVLGRKKKEEDGAIGRVYSFTDAEKDEWANLFEYAGSEGNVRLKFAIDKIGLDLDAISVVFGDFRNGEAWEQFILALKDVRQEEPQEIEVVEEPEVIEAPVVPEKPAIPELPPVSIPPPQERRVPWFFRYRWLMVVGVAGIVLAAVWRIYLSPSPVTVASIDRMKYPLPDKPSIAVLPFVNMSEDPKQEFLCNGMTEEVITALSKVPGVFVISRSSTFTYKGKPVKVKQVSEELGVRHVVEGSVRRSGDRVRVTAQLIDALSGHHLWAERYDRDLEDLFALQDEITIKVLTGVRAKLTGGEDIAGAQKYAEKYYRGRQGLNCYLKLMEAAGYSSRRNIENNNKARRLIEEAIAMCPENPAGYVSLGFVHHHDLVLGNAKSPRESIEKGIELGEKAVAIDDSLSGAHSLLCVHYRNRGEHARAVAEGERAFALDPSNVEFVLVPYANTLNAVGRPKEAIPLMEKAIRLTPFGSSIVYQTLGNAFRFAGRFEEAVAAFKKAIEIAPDNFVAHIGYGGTLRASGKPRESIPLFQKAVQLSGFSSTYAYWWLGGALRDTGQFEEAVGAYKKSIQLQPDNIGAHAGLAATYIMMGREKEARAEVAEVLRINPKYSEDPFIRDFPYKDQSQREKLVKALRKAESEAPRGY